MKRFLFVLALCLVGLAPAQLASAGQDFSGKTVVWVDSYHEGYPWSDGLEQGLRSVLSPAGVRLEVARLDAKRRPSGAEQKEAGEKALAFIQSVKPDLVVASDDNAQEFLVVPFLKDGKLPVVFCGVNWDATPYGYPTQNITGMIEIEDVEEMVRLFQRDAKGPRIGYLSGETSTDRKISQWLNKEYFGGRMNVYFAREFEQYLDLFRKAQEENDMLFLRNNAGVPDWDPARAKEFFLKNVQVPTGSPLEHMVEYVVYAPAKLPEEQGEWSGRTALRILAGEKPADIPMATNERVRLTVNLNMAKAAGIVLPVSILKTASLIGQD